MNPVDIPQIASEYGLFVALVVVVVVAMGWVIKALWSRLNDQIDARFDDQKAHAAQMAENVKAMDRAFDLVGGTRHGA